MRIVLQKKTTIVYIKENTKCLQSPIVVTRADCLNQQKRISMFPMKLRAHDQPPVEKSPIRSDSADGHLPNKVIGIRIRYSAI